LEEALKELQKLEGDRWRSCQTTDPDIWEKAKLLKWERLHSVLNTYEKKDSIALESTNHAGVASLEAERERQGEDFLDKCLLYYHVSVTVDEYAQRSLTYFPIRAL
jgi:hypothetical protein